MVIIEVGPIINYVRRKKADGRAVQDVRKAALKYTRTRDMK